MMHDEVGENRSCVLRVCDVKRSQTDSRFVLPSSFSCVLVKAKLLLLLLLNGCFTLLLQLFQVSIQPVRQAFKVDSTNVTLKAMPGLTSVHLQPNSFEKMRVSIAFQLFGDRVINGLLFYRDKLEASWGEIDATVEFFR